MVAGEGVSTLSDFFRTNLSKRHPVDGINDFYHRGIMVKVLSLFAVVIIVKQNDDSLACIVPSKMQYMQCRDGSCPKIDSFCWSLGLYVYEDLMDKWEDGAPYFGIPRRIEYDGIRNRNSSDQCSTKTSPSSCVKMKRITFYHYQYMYFYLIGLVVLFVIPFLLYNWINQELVILYNLTIEKEDDESARVKKAVLIFNKFLKRKDKEVIEDLPCYKRTLTKITGNIIIRFLYVIIYPISMALFNVVGNQPYENYFLFGYKWAKYSDTTKANPRDQIFPPFGLCDLRIHGYDTTENVAMNKDLTLVCELSPHGLYTFLFLWLWFLLVLGFIVAVLGFIHILVYYIKLAWENDEVGEFRSKYYMDYVKRRNIYIHKTLVGVIDNSSQFINDDFEAGDGMMEDDICLQDRSADA